MSSSVQLLPLPATEPSSRSSHSASSPASRQTAANGTNSPQTTETSQTSFLPNTGGHLKIRTKKPRITALNAFLRNIGASIVNFRRDALLHYDTEEKKIVVDRSLKLAAVRCSVHLLPISATIVLAFLNIKGYFVGAEYQGISGSKASAIDILALQITAKLLELLIVASLSTIVLDVVRHEILFGNRGLPLGLLNVAFEFKDVSFFWSPAFWYSSNAIPSRSQKLILPLAIVISGLIALFAGPSSALLMIPTKRDNWPGGGTPFWLTGTNDTLWPTTLNIDSVGGDFCLDPSAELVNQALLNTSGCIWYSTSIIAQAARNWHLNNRITDLTLTDGLYERLINYHGGIAGDRGADGRDTWVRSSNAAVGLASHELKYLWGVAILNAPIAQTGGSAQTIKYRTRGSTVARVQTLLPVVRSRCNFFGQALSNKVMPLQFPVLPEYEEGSDWSYNISGTLVNSSSILAQWIPVPQGATVTNNGTELSVYPSAFITIQVPDSTSIANSSVFACSIDARWALGDNVATNVDNLSTSTFSQHGEIKSTVSSLPYRGFAPVNDGTWKKIEIDTDWLYTLTPIVNNTGSDEERTQPAMTTVALMLSEAGFTNSTSLVFRWANVIEPLAGVLAVTVAEGLSRIGLSDNGGREIHFTDSDGRLNYPENGILNYPADMNGAWNAVIKGGQAIIPPTGIDSQNLTQVRWVVSVSGLSYYADGPAFYLALLVLLLHTTLALGHIIYKLCTSISSEAWNSLEDMLVLSHSSQPMPHALGNTSGGVRCYTTFQKLVKVRVATGENRVAGHEELQLLVDHPSERGFGHVAIEAEYGIID